ncbi:hypothetical protein HG530_004904 [Fusarium avenaceum]|nr:hypothetical protein HG530_004904 [Fusarium avenaceum]
MTSIGTGYDLLNSIFSPDGRNFQVEYAVKAVESGGTSIGIRAKDGVVLAIEKVVSSKLLKPGANKRIATIDAHVGAVSSGMVPDGRHFVDRARDEAQSWRQNFKTPIPTSDLASRMGGYLQAYTMYGSVRPFGITAIVGGYDTPEETPVDGEVGSGPSVGAGGKVNGKHGGPFLYMIEPSGMYWGYFGAATGKGRQVAKAELEKLDLPAGNITLEEAVKQAARIIYIAQKDNKDKDFELEMTWISGPDGPTKGRHVEVLAPVVPVNKEGRLQFGLALHVVQSRLGIYEDCLLDLGLVRNNEGRHDNKTGRTGCLCICVRVVLSSGIVDLRQQDQQVLRLRGLDFLTIATCLSQGSLILEDDVACAVNEGLCGSCAHKIQKGLLGVLLLLLGIIGAVLDARLYSRGELLVDGEHLRVGHIALGF